MSLKELAQVINQAASAIKSNEKFATYSLARKASKAAEELPYDTALISVAQVLTKMAENKTFTSRQELNKLYDQFYTNSTHLGEVFAEELGRQNLLKGATVYNRGGETGESLNDYEQVADPVLANALSAAFSDKKARFYSAKVATAAQKMCNAGLLEIGLAPRKIDVFAGQEDMIVCQATWQTPKGETHVLIPIEIKAEKSLLPTMFLGRDGFVDLTTDSLKQHILTNAGKSFFVDGEKLLQALSQARYGVKKIASDVEMAAIRLRADRGEQLVGTGILGIKMAEIQEDFKEPEVEKHAEHFEFGKRVTKADGAARFLFNDRVVEAGRDHLVRKMASFGYKHVQVKVANVAENEIQYAIGVGVNAAILAPLKVEAGQIKPATIAVASGKVMSFDKSGIDELVKQTRPDNRMLAVASPSYGLKPADLINQVKEAAMEGNLLKAEDAINVLGEVDKSAQKVAIAILMKSLNGSPNFETQAKEMDKVASVKQETPLFSSYQIFYPEGR